MPTYVGWARQLGFPRVSVTTNGRRLAYDEYCRQLVAAGANRFYISVHGHTAKLHDALTRTPGAFEQTRAGIANVARADVELHTCTVVTRQNVPHFREVYSFLRGLGADQVVFNILQPNGRADTHFERVVPRYGEITTAFVGFLEVIEEERPPVYLVDLPPCAAVAVPELHRGWVETYVHHEVAGTVEPHLGQGMTYPLVERRRADFDAELRSKREECARCTAERTCAGVWNNYLARYGWEELEPLTRQYAVGEKP